MTDARPTGPRATVCPEEGCHALIPGTVDDRREHRAGHAHTRKVERAIRAELQDVRTLVGQLREDNARFRRELENIKIPEPVEPLSIDEWPEDELDELDDLDTDDVEAVQRSQYADDAVFEHAPAPDIAPASDDDDDDDRPFATVYTPGRPVDPT